MLTDCSLVHWAGDTGNTAKSKRPPVTSTQPRSNSVTSLAHEHNYGLQPLCQTVDRLLNEPTHIIPRSLSCGDTGDAGDVLGVGALRSISVPHSWDWRSETGSSTLGLVIAYINIDTATTVGVVVLALAWGTHQF